jgi:predicted porin
MGAITAANGTANRVSGANEEPRLWSVAATYANGPLGIGLTYERHDEVGANVPGGGSDLDDKAWGAAIGYRFGPVRVGATYLDAKYETGPGTELKKKSWTVGFDWTIAGPHMISAQYADIGDSKGNSPVGVGGTSNGAHAASGGDTGANAWSLAYQYSFSKRTTVKVGYVKVNNDSNTGSYRIGNSAALLDTGSNVDGYAFLVKHNF